MKAEITALEMNDIWVVINLFSGKVVIGCKWVYKIKFNADGSVERYKVRFVAKGYIQQEGLDYYETFSFMAKLVTVRILLAVAVIRGWFMYQLDVNNVFLYGDLDEEVYMQLFSGYFKDDESKVCKFRKSLYGFKQVFR